MSKTKLVVNVTRGNALCVGEMADRAVPRMRGLIGRRGLPSGEGMLLSPAPAIHTAFMRFPIDALFLDRDFRVVEIVERLGPWRIASKRRARAVLELAAGESARCGVKIGDTLALRDRRPVNPESAGPHARQVAVAEVGESAEIARIRPLSVLIVSDDRQFRSVLSLLLGRRGCSVSMCASASRGAEQVARNGADVVVIDATRPDAESCATAVEALARPVGVVLVAEKAREGSGGRKTLPKWGPFSALAQAVEQADGRRGSWGEVDGR
jgi:uncharacterized protein